MTTTQTGRTLEGLASNHSSSLLVGRPDPSLRRTARIVGVLFLAGYLAYGVGSLLAHAGRPLR